MNEFKIKAFAINNDTSVINEAIPDTGNQTVVFCYDNFIKGKLIAMKLTQGLISAPNIEIYLEYNVLKSLLNLFNELEDDKGFKKSFKPSIPIWRRNQTVTYINKRGGKSRGRITYLETHYSEIDGSAYHIYCVHTDGHKRSAWVSEKDIIEGN